MNDAVAEDRRLLWHPFTQTSEWLSYEPLVVESADGFFLIDTRGRRYLDAVSSIWCNVHGHGQRRIVDAIKEQAERVCHSTLLGLSHVPALELARRLVDVTPEGLTRVFYSDSGSTAVEVAIRMAFQYWRQSGHGERDRFITLANAYHGDTLGAVSLGRSEPFHLGYEAITFEVSKFRPPFLCPPLKGRGRARGEALDEASRSSLGELEQLLEVEGRRTAAVVIEPLVQGAAGIWPQPPSFVAGVRELCDRYGVLMVCDEVATGFGRSATMFAVEQAGVAPDLMCLAKGITGGYLPLAATLATESIYQAFEGAYSDYRTLFHGHTYGGNPLGCAAAIANLEVFAKEKTLEKAAAGAEALDELLSAYIEPLTHAGPPRRVGMMAGFDLLRDPARGLGYPVDERRGHRAVAAAREEGVIIRPLGDTMVLMPPLAMPAELIEQAVAVTARAVDLATGEKGGKPRMGEKYIASRGSAPASSEKPPPCSPDHVLHAHPENLPLASRLLITGTDTGVGKTLVATAILAAARDAGLRTAAFKPVETGCRQGPGGLVGEDCERLGLAAARVGSAYLFPAPAAPLVAAEAEGVSIEQEKLVRTYDELASQAQLVLVEGAGGLMVPLAEDSTFADLAARLDLAVVLVVGSKLGCINHALLTLETARARGLKIAGYIVNELGPAGDDPALNSNRRTIARFTGAADLGRFPFIEAAERDDLGLLAETARKHLDLDKTGISPKGPKST